MPQYIMKCPHCGGSISKTMMFDKNGKASGNSGLCHHCHKRVKWWGERNRARIVKD